MIARSDEEVELFSVRHRATAPPRHRPAAPTLSFSSAEGLAWVANRSFGMAICGSMIVNPDLFFSPTSAADG